MSARPSRIAAVLAGGLSALLLVSPNTGAVAAPSANVVPPGGRVAGHGYAYWMERHWQFVFSLNAPAARSPDPCHVLTANGTRVAWLSGPFSTGAHACSEPAGRPIYLNLVSTICSTYRGQHPGFGSSDAQLRRCSRSHFDGIGTPAATVDGRAVDVPALLTATGAFAVHAVAGNPIGVAAGNGRAAAYGIGLLLAGFAQGTHTIHCVVHGQAEQNLTWIIHAS